MFHSSALSVATTLIIATAALAADPSSPAAAPSSDRLTFSVTGYGAVGDGKTLCTPAIQKAIDACAEAGGGTVLFPPGTYLSGTVFLKSHVTLHLEAAATLLGSPNLADYPSVPAKIESRTNQYNLRSVIFAEDLDKIAITGRGTLDGNGAAYKQKRHDGNRPLILRVINCRDVRVENIQMRNSGFWNQHYLACTRVVVRGIRVFNHATYNADGIDIDGCRDFVLTDSFVDSDDDAICLKSTLERPCENVLISNCVVSSHCNAIKMGTDSTGGFINVTITNCSIISPRDSQVIYGLQRGISGISLELVDGGRLERVAISNVTIDGVSSPICLRLGNRAQPVTPDAPKPPVGAVRNLTFSHIIATRASRNGCPITGIPGHPIENLTLNNVRMEFEGGGTTEDAARAIPELENAFPKSVMFGTLPAYGLWFRHVKNLRLLNVQHALTGPDARPAMIFDDVEDVLVDGQKPRQVRPTSMTAE